MGRHVTAVLLQQVAAAVNDKILLRNTIIHSKGDAQTAHGDYAWFELFAKNSATVVHAQTRCCPRRWLRHHEQPQCEEGTPGRPLQPLMQHDAAVQQVPEEHQLEQQTGQSCSTGTHRI